MSDEDKSPFTTDQSSGNQSKAFRVKVYKLDADGAWEDQGTGYCVYKTEGDGEVDEINVTSERDNSTTLLSSKVLKHKEYQRQQETLIVWTEGNNTDLALSFEEPGGCEHIWYKIHEKTGNDDPPTLNADSDDDDTPSIRAEPGAGALPSPELSNLPAIANALANAKTLQAKDRYASFIIPENYIEKLVNVFNTCEDLESIEELHKLYTIMKAIIMLNDNTIIEHIVRDDIYPGVMGMLESSTMFMVADCPLDNPDKPTSRTKHRDFLAKCAAIQPVVPIRDKATFAKIHETYRIKYLKEIIFSDSRDDALGSLLHSLIFFNDIDIISNIQKDTELLTEIFEIFSDEKSTTERKVEASKFILQICNMAKTLQPAHRASLYRTLCSFGFLNMFLFALTAESEGIRTSACYALSSVIELEATFMRSQLLQNIKENGKKRSLMALIIDRLTMDTDKYLKVQFAEIIRLLIDLANGPMMGNPMASDSMRKQDTESEEFVNRFFTDFSSDFLKPLDSLEKQQMKLDGPIENLELTKEQGDIYIYICDLLCFIIRQHSSKVRPLLTTSDLCTKIMQLYRCKQAAVKLSAVKFVRTCVGILDGFYIQSLIKNNVFEPTIRILLDTDGKDNLLNSACIELLEFIRKENIRPLINHLVAQFGSVLDTLTYAPTFKALRLRYEQNQEASESRPSDADNSSSANNARGTGLGGWSSTTVDEEEEGYFNNSGDEEDALPLSSFTKGSPSTTSKPLVNYEDDDDDDDDDGDADDIELEETMSSSDTASFERKQDTKDTSDQDDSAISKPHHSPNRKRKHDEEDNAGDIGNMPPLRLKSDDEDDEDDMLAAKAVKKVTRSPTIGSKKRIVINARGR
ncbi:component of IIS longevity pathway SMK-1-domain-containing protein [Dichotomocladium elegans]|nr:component of IIS longevity pathway SMK-1-domain-containing protein [Dichotomocladium elegans]